MDFLISGHFFGASERGSGRHKVTLWRPEKMAAREKDAADAGIYIAQPSERKTAKAFFLSRQGSVSGAQAENMPLR